MAHPTSPARDLRDALRRGDCSATEAVEHALARAEADTTGAFVSIEPEIALRDAREADRLRQSDPDRTPSALLGLPTAHKDLVRVRGFRTTHGSRALPHDRATADDPIARSTRRAGAITIAKTQVSEFGIAGYSENLISPPARNPVDPARTAGGSSGGTAAAVASGIIPAAIASDGGGSIRIPSAACGLVGLKPGRGAIPADALRGERDESGGPQLGVSGPIARSALDAALWLDAVREVVPGPGPGPAERAVERAAECTGLRIGVSFDSPFETMLDLEYSAEARAAVAAGIDRLEAAGHHVESASIRYAHDYPDSFTTVWTSGLIRLDLDAEAEERLGALARDFRRRAARTSPEALRHAIERLDAFAAEAAGQWGDYDALLTPALAFAAPHIGAFTSLSPEHDYARQCAWAPHTSMVNVVGWPAVVAPTSLTAAGLPMGVQLIARPGAEPVLLQLAAHLMTHP